MCTDNSTLRTLGVTEAHGQLAMLVVHGTRRIGTNPAAYVRQRLRGSMAGMNRSSSDRKCLVPLGWRPNRNWLGVLVVLLAGVAAPASAADVVFVDRTADL